MSDKSSNESEKERHDSTRISHDQKIPATDLQNVTQASATGSAQSSSNNQSTSGAQTFTASQAAINAKTKSSSYKSIFLSSSQQALSMASAGEGLTKWEQDVFRDILNNANNTLRFQVQLAVPLLAGCVTALNIIPPQAHQELLNLLDRWVFIPVLLSMGVAYYGLELHWVAKPGDEPDNVNELTRLIRKKYDVVHTAIVLQAVGLVLLMVFVLLEYK